MASSPQRMLVNRCIRDSPSVTCSGTAVSPTTVNIFLQTVGKEIILRRLGVHWYIVERVPKSNVEILLPDAETFNA